MQGFYRREEEPLHTRKKSYVLRQMDGSGELFPGTEITTLNEADGAQTREEQSVYQAGCGHFIGFESAAELASSCSFCGKTLCFRCGHLRCRRCLKILCESCAKILDETTVYCKWCRVVVLAKRAAKAGVKGLHEFLSKEF